MPTYEYICEACGYQFERVQRITDEKIEECPRCRQLVTRLIGKGGGIILKGKQSASSRHRSDAFQGQTCYGRDERCDIPPCSRGGACERE